MTKNKKFLAILSAISLFANNSYANEEKVETEQCKVTKDGKGLIKERKADCAGANHDCASQNKAGDPISFILVPKGQCAKINAGDFTNASKEIKDKIEGAQ